MKYLKVFTDFAQSIEPLSDAEKGRLFTAMLEYAETGTEPRFSGNERFLWPTAKSHIDREAAFCEKQRTNAMKAKPSQTEPNEAKPSQTSQKDKDKDKEYKETLPIGSAKKAAPAFHPPTVDEVKAYCEERNNSVDAARFVDYYTANGWKVGKNPMKDWRAAVRTWERDDRPSGIDRARKNNTLLNYKEEGRAYASLDEIKLDLSELDDDPPAKSSRRKKRDMYSLGDGTTPHVNLDDIALTLEDEL